jgi:AcrR family transcriptional regulator
MNNWFIFESQDPSDCEGNVAQVLKDEVEARIREAALDVFSARGYPGARMAEIASRAGVSTGNIYHYFRDKRTLFNGVIPDSLVREFWSVLERRLEAASGVGTAAGLSTRVSSDAGTAASSDTPVPPTSPAPYPVAARATVDFALQHRRETVFLLGRATGTPHADLADRVVARLVAAALDHATTAGRQPSVTPALRFDLEEIYRAYVHAWVRILERFPDPGHFQEALSAYERYHLAGLRALLE